MEQSNALGNQAPDLTDHRWLPVEALEPGMLLARPVVAVQKGVLCLKLAEGTELTASSIGQMYTRGVECVAVAAPPPVEDEAWLAQCAAYADRLAIIFGSADAAMNPDCQPLHDLLLALGPQR